jgi:hypothetical protein
MLMGHPVFWLLLAAVAAPLLAEIPVGFRVPVVVFGLDHHSDPWPRKHTEDSFFFSVLPWLKSPRMAGTMIKAKVELMCVS